MGSEAGGNNTFRSDADHRLDAQLEQEIQDALGGKSIDEVMDEAEASRDASASAGGVPGLKRGKVIGVTGSDIFVDLGGRSQGVITSDQFEPDKLPQVGDTIEVLIERYDEREGMLILSRQGVAQKTAWATMALGDMVEARVTGVNKGGLECDLKGIRAFMPASQVDIVRIEDVSTMIGQRLTAEIVELDRNDKNVVLSRRKMLERQAAESREQTMAELAEGQVRTGTVRNIMPFGAFLDIGGVDGLLHVSDMSYSRVDDPKDVVKLGQKLNVQVLKIEQGGKRISLGLKQLLADPWENVVDKYKAGQAVKGKVTNLAKFGAFVEVEPGLEALIPIGEMTWKKRINHPSEILSKGQAVEVSVLEVDPTRKRMSVSLKAFEPDPWSEVERKYPIGAAVEGTVTRLADFGAFIELEPGVDGLAHISELSSKPIQRPSDAVRQGQKVQARVLHVSASDRRISLTLKGEDAPEAEAAPSGEAAKPAKKRQGPLRGGLE
ncbi:MAG TPA: S1 RNA-binding domain-containing protein [Phycisphaerae bacterium]|mgnify:CR=1 FL=1|nr:S1 RNA-binding domain-containing protein [Phycisphaerae bacterium]